MLADVRLRECVLDVVGLHECKLFGKYVSQGRDHFTPRLFPPEYFGVSWFERIKM